MLLFVFTQIFRIGDDVPHYPVMLLFNIVVFTFFQEATIAAVTSVVAQEGWCERPSSAGGDPARGGADRAVQLRREPGRGPGLPARLRVPAEWTWLFFLLLVLVLTVITTAVCLLVSLLFVRFRDVGIIWACWLRRSFYATPVLYPIEVVPERFHDIVLINPLTPIFFTSCGTW